MPRLRNLSINRVGMEIISTSWIACNERPSAARLFRLIDFGAADSDGGTTFQCDS